MASIRIYPELRAVHLERDRVFAPAETWYFRLNDLDPADVPRHFRRVGPVPAVVGLLRTDARVIEVPEPLWARFLPVDLLLLLAVRLGALVRRRRVRVCTYAMENNEPGTALLGTDAPRTLRRIVTGALGFLVRLLVDRIAFASHGSESTYAALGVRDRGPVACRLFGELPTAVPTPGRPDPSSVLFVGVLEDRKGLGPLLRAWADVERAHPGARLTVVGSGPLEPAVAGWVAAAPDRRRFLGRLAHADVLDAVASAAVVVAPSVRDGRWREQIGLPMKEGLAAGATIVTTTETGLASWLDAHGHVVLDPDTLDRTLAAGIVRALRAPLPRAAVRGSLPDEDGRVTADRWLHER